MKKSLQDKLKKYGTMAAAVAGGVASADAQIVYTDVVPDSTFCNDGDVYNLDLNNDMINDFAIVKSSSTSYGYGGSYPNIYSWSSSNRQIDVNPMASNQVLRMGSGAAALSSGASIGASASSWGGSTYMAQGYYSWSYSMYTYYSTSYGTQTNTWSSYWSYSSGNWKNQNNSDKYLGLEFKIGTQTHYGWARLSVDNANCFTIEEYAYESTPNTTILAGDKGLSTSISDLNLIPNVTVYAANEVLNVKVPAEVIGFNVKLIDMLGRTIVNETIASSNHKVDIANNSKGVYIVLIEGEGKAFSEKITIN